MKKTVLIMAGVASLLAADLATAQTPPTAAPPPPPGADGPARAGHGFGQEGPGRRMMWRHHHRHARPSLEDVQKRNAEAFAKMDANRDGRVTFEEFRQDMERRRLERQQTMFKRFSGGQESVTLDQLNARAAERYDDRGRRGPDKGAPPAR